MCDRNAIAPGREAEKWHGVRVPEHDDEVGPLSCQLVLGSLEDRPDPRGRIGRQRPRLVRAQFELVKEGRAHRGIPVLTRRDRPDAEARGHELPDDGDELDDLGPGAERHEDAGQPSKTSSK